MATKQREVYKCDKCGNMVEVVHESGGTLSCCGQAMTRQDENTKEAAVEKHVPVIEKIAGGYKVSVGSVAHPMTAEHSIEWIELIDGNVSQIKFLKAGEAPVAEFKSDAANVSARAYCNLHGFWKSA